MGFERIKDFLADENENRKPPSPESLKKGARIAFAASAIGGASLTEVDAREVPIVPKIEQQEKKVQVLSEEEIKSLAVNIFHEARGEPSKGQDAVAQITLARLLIGKGFGKTIDKVISAKSQFSWTEDPNVIMRKWTDQETEELKNIEARIAFIVGNKSLSEVVQFLSESTGIPVDAFWYKRYDVKSSFFDSGRLEEVGQIGNHVFYRLKKTAPQTKQGVQVIKIKN